MLSKTRHRSFTALRLDIERLEDRTLLTAEITFAEPVLYPAGCELQRVVAADVDDDEILDLVVLNSFCVGRADRLPVLLGNGDGSFTPQRMISVQSDASIRYYDIPSSAVADFDGDSRLDMLAGIIVSPGPPNWGWAFMPHVVSNLGSTEEAWKGFSQPEVIQELQVIGLGTRAGDLDGDGDFDIVVGGVRNVHVYLNNGNTAGQWNGFADPVEIYADGKHASNIGIGDIDQDSDLDVIVADYFGGDVTVLRNDGGTNFSQAAKYDVGGSIGSVNVRDFDGDKNLDVAVSVFRTNHIATLFGKGDATFTQPFYHPVSGLVGSNTEGDFDNDGDLDLAVVAGTNYDELRLLVNEGDGTFFEQEGWYSDIDPQGGFGTTADLDGDGRLDLVIARGAVHVFLNTTDVATGGLPDDSPQHVPGDANLDGVFDQLDIVQVHQAAKYLTGEPATFAEGDWNGDGVFDRQDLLLALFAGNYLPR